MKDQKNNYKSNCFRELFCNNFGQDGRHFQPPKFNSVSVHTLHFMVCAPLKISGWSAPQKMWGNSFSSEIQKFHDPPPVGARNRCHLSNWRFNPETVHFLSSKRPFLPTIFVSKCYKTKHFGQDSLFHKKPKLGRKNHYFYSVEMGERAKSL